MNKDLAARLAEIEAMPPVLMTPEDEASLKAAQAINDGTTENIRDYIRRKAKTSKAQQEAVHRYVKKNYDRIDLVLPKGQKAEIKDVAAQTGESVNGFVLRIISEALAQSRTSKA